MAKSKPKAVPAPIAGMPAPPDLETEFAQFFVALVAEVKALRTHATRADIEMCATAARSAQGEANARMLAQQALILGDTAEYRDQTKLAQSESRSKQAALSSLQLTGDRRGSGQARRNAAAMTQNLDDEDDIWGDI